MNDANVTNFIKRVMAVSLLQPLMATLGLLASGPLRTAHHHNPSRTAYHPNTMMMASDDTCEITTLDASQSTVFGSHYQVEAWICPTSAEEQAAPEQLDWQQKGECLQIMHQGKRVLACAVDPIGQRMPSAG